MQSSSQADGRSARSSFFHESSTRALLSYAQGKEDLRPQMHALQRVFITVTVTDLCGSTSYHTVAIVCHPHHSLSIFNTKRFQSMNTQIGWPEPYICTVYLVISLPKTPYIHGIFTVYIWFWPTLHTNHGELDCSILTFSYG